MEKKRKGNMTFHKKQKVAGVEGHQKILMEKTRKKKRVE